MTVADTSLPGVLLEGDHALRPAAADVASGTLYSCSTHGLVYQSDLSTWATWATMGGGAPAAHDASHENGGGDELSVAGLSGLLADAQTPLGHQASHDGGADDLNGDLTPAAHAASHQNGGSDEIDVTGLTGAGGGTPAYVGCKAYHSTTQSIADAGSGQAITFDSEEFDSGTIHDTSTNPTRFVAPVTGKYLLEGSPGGLASGASPVLGQLWWRKGGSTSLRSSITWIPSSGQQTGFVCSTIVALTAAEYVELMMYQDSSGARNIGHASAPENQSWASITLLGT